jgi:peptidyl-prolyl cis-trans isomerase C
MRCKLLICATVVTLAAGLSAQVASHAPTSVASKTNSTVVYGTLDAPTGKPVVKVNGAALDDRDLTREMMNVFPYAKQHGGKFPKEAEPDIRKKALRNIELEELAYQQAKKSGMTVSQAKLDKAVKDFKTQFDGEAQFQQYLKAEQNGSMQVLRAKIQRAILIDENLKAEIDNKAKMTDAQLRDFYQKNPDRFRKPDSVSIQTITVAYGDNPSVADKKKARQRADDAWKEAKATKDYEGFGMLAEKVSMDDWRVMMGDHKWLHRGRMPKQVEAVVFKMKAGRVSDVIDTGDSFCIVRVNGIEPSHIVPFDEIKAELKKDLEQQKADELRASYEARLRRNASIQEL